MENTQIIAERIKAVSQSRGVSVKQVLNDCGVDKNIVNKLSNGKDTGTQTIVKIANYLECSADYLLGRTNDPNTTGISVTDNKQLSLTGNNSISINASRNNSTSDNPDDKQLLEMIKSLDLVERSKIITQIDEMKNKK